MKVFALSLGTFLAVPFGSALAVTSLVAAIDPWREWALPSVLALPTIVGLLGIYAGLA